MLRQAMPCPPMLFRFHPKVSLGMHTSGSHSIPLSGRSLRRPVLSSPGPVQAMGSPHWTMHGGGPLSACCPWQPSGKESPRNFWHVFWDPALFRQVWEFNYKLHWTVLLPRWQPWYSACSSFSYPWLALQTFQHRTGQLTFIPRITRKDTLLLLFTGCSLCSLFLPPLVLESQSSLGSGKTFSHSVPEISSVSTLSPASSAFNFIFRQTFPAVGPVQFSH